MSAAYRFILQGSQQVPGVISSASGFGTAIFDSITNALTYTMTVTGLDWGAFLGQAAETASATDNVTDAHFHSGARGANGGVIMPWLSDVDDFTASAPSGGTRTISGQWELTDLPSIAAFTALLNSGVLGADIGVYANIHSAAFPGGELRGQFVTIATDASETVNGTAAADLLPGLGGDDIVIGGLGNDTVTGDAGVDRLYGSEGNDTIDTGVGMAGSYDYAYGGDGDDIIRATGTNQIVAYGDFYNSTVAPSTVAGNDTIDLSGAGFAYAYGGGGADTITGSSGGDTLYGDEGNDTINAGDGFDTILGGDGDDDLNGGLGRDNIYGGAGNDILRSGGEVSGGQERLFGGDGNDTIYATAPGRHFIFGDEPFGVSGNDTVDMTAVGLNPDSYTEVWMRGGVDTVLGSDGTDYIYGEDGSDTLNGRGGRDVLFGGNDDDFVYGGDGSDDLYGEFGADSLYGGADADFIYGNRGSDTIDGGDGRDYIEASYDGDTVYGGLGDDIVYAGADSDFLYGGDGSDYLYGEQGADSLYGGAGVDVLFIDSTDVVYDGGADRDYLVWQDVSAAANVNLAAHSLDYAYGYTGADIFYATGATTRIELHGGGGNDVLVGGGSGGSILLGEGDNDRLVSEIGIDHMVGGSGADTFVFSANGATDYVYDFTSGADKADFTALASAGIHSLANLTIITAYSGAGWYGYNYGSGTAWLNTTAAGGTQPVAGDFLFA